MKILEVLFRNDDKLTDVKVGDIITMAQWGAYCFEYGRSAYVAYDDMTPMNKGDRWIYFLDYYDDPEGYFKNINHEYGIRAMANDEKSRVFYSKGYYDGRWPIPDNELMQIMDEFNELPVEVNRHYHNISQENRENGNAFYRFSRDAHSRIDNSALGVLNKYDFNFALYSEILEHFDIQAQDWVNPGRSRDAKLMGLISGNNMEGDVLD
jgi:hypothetical protein